MTTPPKTTTAAAHEAILVLFPSVHWALKAERALTDAGRQPAIIPVPKSITSDCGVCITIRPEDHDAILSIISTAGVMVDALYRFDGRHATPLEGVPS